MEKVLPLLWQTTSNPDFKNDDLQRFKESRMKDLEYNQAKFNYRATQLMFAAMFPNDLPIGTILSKEHIEAITIEQLQAYHQQLFTSQNIRVFMTGNLDDVMLRRLDDEMMKRLKDAKTMHPTQFISSAYQKQIVEQRENALQSSIILCRKNIAYNHVDRRNFEVLSVLFGGFFGSRLMQNLREKNGYTYGVFCSSLFYENESIFYIETDVMAEKTKNAIAACFEEMKLLHKELADEEELALVKSFMLGELLREVDGSVSYQKKYAYWNDFLLDETEMQAMIDTIYSITREKIQTLAKQYLVPEMFTTVVVGKME